MRGYHFLSHFKGLFEGAKTFLTSKLSRAQCSREMAQKEIIPPKKIMSQIFLNSGTLVILCRFATMGPQFYSVFAGQSLLSHFKGHFDRAKTFLTPKIVTVYVYSWAAMWRLRYDCWQSAVFFSRMAKELDIKYRVKTP